MRGALTAGRVSVSQDDRLFVGPAIIDAYKFERENAIYPRIIFVNEIENYIAKTQINYTYIAVDQDKVKYLDFIKFNFDKEGLSKKTLDNLLTTQGIKGILKSKYATLMVDHKSENNKIAQKYGWLISKFADHGINVI
jgi:hypothetical protein